MLGGEKPDLPKQSQMLIPDPKDVKDAGNADSRNEAKLQTSHGILKSRNKARWMLGGEKPDFPKRSQIAPGR
ncbi:hypothetical protein K1W69_01930 [Hoeflea sp. WL0058]|uniref:Uncharacterized protein n=1 Tax=Flavimaribacter sediminis TaxID=2865987 RepID=A0AAE2ZG39_9HYPH|nr:hypothetical protein [Flavimaribacter sediminis]MBW8635928.1 hypothetical protein [Flavimaribacter sediminis]